MAIFKYEALDPRSNETAVGTVTASSKKDATAKIRDKGLLPSSVEEVKAVAKAKKPKGKAKSAGGMNMEIKMPASMSRVKSKQLMGFTRQLSTLLQAGMPLMRSLEVLTRQERNPALKAAIDDMIDGIRTGQSFADCLAQHSKIFDRLYINMVKAGELGGVLDVVLDRLAEFMEKSHKLKQKVIGSMTYPVVVLMVAVGIVYFLMTTIIPKFEDIFSGMLSGAKLPPLTQAVMKFSNNMTAGILPVVIGIVVIIFAIKFICKSPKGRLFFDRLKLFAPLFGKLVKIGAIARFSRTLGTLMSSGVPILQALLIVRETVGNAVIEKAVGEVHDAVKEGENMADPIANCGVFPPIVNSMVEVGEETGELPQMLVKIADAYDDEVDNAVTALSSVIEPLLIVGLAVVVGTIVIALFMPLTQIIGKM